jgi:hypothetical protein
MPEPRDPLLKVFAYFFFKTVLRREQSPAAKIEEFGAAGEPRLPERPPETTLQGYVHSGLELKIGSIMIPPLVHQRRPCYDFYFL